MKVTVSVSNDLYNDNRVLKICESLRAYGWSITVICKNAAKERKHNYKDFESSHPFLRTKRLKFLFKKNVGYYAELNLRLFFTLLFTKSDILWANDLDTLPANYLAAILKHKPLVFDSHEMFCYVAELKPGSIQQKVWLAVEGWIVPKLKYIVTVCDPIREYFKNKYGVNSTVIRNIPPQPALQQSKSDIYKDGKYIIWQGSVNVDRGLEELVESMQYVNCKLLICGEGDIFYRIRSLTEKLNLQDKVKLTGKLPYDTMMDLTRNAVLGISIDKPTNGNYAISLPNKIFEYINVCLPVLYSPLSEIKKIEDEFKCGIELKSYDAKELSAQINGIISDGNLLKELADNCLSARKVLNWHNEEKILYNLAEKITSEESLHIRI